MPFPAPAGLKTQTLIIHVYPFSLVIVTKLKDILVKSCTLQKSETHLDLHKILCREENYGLLHEVPLNFLAYTADLMQASKVFYPGVAPGVEGADVLERVTSLDLTVCCLLFVRCGA